jgi:hypothetical protein
MTLLLDVDGIAFAPDSDAPDGIGTYYADSETLTVHDGGCFVDRRLVVPTAPGWCLIPAAAAPVSPTDGIALLVARYEPAPSPVPSVEGEGAVPEAP